MRRPTQSSGAYWCFDSWARVGQNEMASHTMANDQQSPPCPTMVAERLTWEVIATGGHQRDQVWTATENEYPPRILARTKLTSLQTYTPLPHDRPARGGWLGIRTDETPID